MTSAQPLRPRSPPPPSPPAAIREIPPTRSLSFGRLPGEGSTAKPGRLPTQQTRQRTQPESAASATPTSPSTAGFRFGATDAPARVSQFSGPMSEGFGASQFNGPSSGFFGAAAASTPAATTTTAPRAAPVDDPYGEGGGFALDIGTSHSAKPAVHRKIARAMCPKLPDAKLVPTLEPLVQRQGASGREAFAMAMDGAMRGGGP